MKFQRILEDYYNREKTDHKREFGVYWASDLYPMIKGYLKPKNFYDQRDINLQSAKMIATGEAMEAQTYKILTGMNIDFEYQAKRQIKVTDRIRLTAKPDFVLKDCIIETKFPFSKVDVDIPERYQYQLEAYWRAFKKPVYLGVLTIPFDLTTILYIPKKAVWEKIQTTLEKFHESLK
jgi:hypothetical protein